MTNHFILLGIQWLTRSNHSLDQKWGPKYNCQHVTSKESQARRHGGLTPTPKRNLGTRRSTKIPKKRNMNVNVKEVLG